MKPLISLRRFALIAFGGVCVLALPVRAIAQVEAGGSYQVLHDRQVTLPAGWQVSVGENITDRWALIGDVSGSSKTLPAFNLRTYAFLTGPKFRFQQGRRVTTFGQMLFGAVRDIDRCCTGTRLNSVISRTFLSVQPGIGADFHIVTRVALRLETDFRFVRRFGSNERAPRYVIGMVVK